MAKDPIVYRYRPANPGESLVSHGVPARDLTQADWDRLEPAARYQALAPGPSGEPMYVKVEKKGAAGASGPTGATGAAGATGANGPTGPAGGDA